MLTTDTSPHSAVWTCVRDCVDSCQKFAGTEIDEILPPRALHSLRTSASTDPRRSAQPTRWQPQRSRLRPVRRPVLPHPHFLQLVDFFASGACGEGAPPAIRSNRGAEQRPSKRLLARACLRIVSWSLFLIEATPTSTIPPLFPCTFPPPPHLHRTTYTRSPPATTLFSRCISDSDIDR